MADPFDRIDWASPRLPRQPYAGNPAQLAGNPYSPLASALATWGVQQPPGFWQDLSRWAAPTVNRTEQFMAGVRGAAGEATGLPAAGRAGEAVAEGMPMQAAGQALQALPSRLTQIPGMLISEAAAAGLDPREARIQKLDSDISKTQKAISDLGRRTRDPDRLEVLARPHQQMLDRLSAERKGLQEAIDTEASEAAAAERRRQASAEWRNTPLAKRYPGLLPTTAGTGLTLGLAIGGMYGGRRVANYNTRIREIDQQWSEAVGRAENTRLKPATRQAAANQARALQQEFQQLTGEGPGFGHAALPLASFAGAELGMGTPAIADYATGVPGAGEVFMDPMTYARAAGVGGPAAALGKLEDLAIRSFVERPTGYAGRTEGLPQTFRAPRRRR